MRANYKFTVSFDRNLFYEFKGMGTSYDAYWHNDVLGNFKVDGRKSAWDIGWIIDKTTKTEISTRVNEQYFSQMQNVDFHKKSASFTIEYDRRSQSFICNINFDTDILTKEKSIDLFLKNIPSNKIINYLKDCGFWFKNAKNTKNNIIEVINKNIHEEKLLEGFEPKMDASTI